MELIWTLPAFLLAVLLISASPGPAMALIFRRAALQGFRGSVGTVLGLEAGLYVWALLAGAGLAALVAASESAYLVLRVLGAALLVYLGVRSWRAAWRGTSDGLPATDGPAERGARPGYRRAFGEGLIVQLANPKAAVFMFAFYPQFIPQGWPLLPTTAWLALLQVTVETALYLGLAAAVARAGTWFRRPRIRSRVDALSGTVLVGLGLRLAATSR